MNRRDFLAYTALTPLFTNELFASDGDIYLSKDEWKVLVSVNSRLKRLRSYIGYANFNLLSFHDALFYGRNYSKIGTFTKIEIAFIDKLFYEDPKKYGFYGEKTCFDINYKVSKKDVIKIPHTGHYIYRGQA